MPAVSKKQQRFFGMVRAAQKGEMKNPSKEVSDVAGDISMKDAKKFAKTKHKGLPEKKVEKESFDIDKSAHRTAQKKAKLRNLAKGNMNPNVKAAAEKKAGGPKLAFEGWKDKAIGAMKRVTKKKDAPKHDYGRDAGAEAKKRLRKKDHETVNFLDPDD